MFQKMQQQIIHKSNTYQKFLKKVSYTVKSNMSATYCIVYLDIVHFKYINHEFGYQEGNFLLRNVSVVLSRFIEKDECFGRIYADRYVLLLRFSNNEDVLNRFEKLELLQKRMLKSLKKPYNVFFKCGIYVLKENDDVNMAINQANFAKCSNPKQYQNTYSFFTPEMNDSINREKNLERKMGEAIQKKEFVPFYQPKINIETGEVIGAEALVRWLSGGVLIQPDDFIPFFEKTGFVINVDYYIYEMVCMTLKKWLNLGHNVIPVSCNFSKLHINETDFVERLTTIADNYNVPHDLLQIEITESIPVENWETFISVGKQIKNQGFGLALDDFGVAYSSMALIANLPLDTIKIDKIFLDENQGNPIELDILSLLISVLKKNNVEVLCEGVETLAHEKIVKEMGCDQAQGFLYSVPLPLKDFESLITPTPPSLFEKEAF